MIHKIHVLLKQYGERGIILTKRNLSLSMKIVLLLLSSAILAILCYAFFRNNVTDFYTFIETVEKPFNEKTFIKGFKEEAKNISIYSKDKNDKKELKNLLKKHDDYTNILLCNEKELYIDGSLGKILDEPVGFTPLYILKSDFEQYAFNNFFTETITFKDGEGIVYVSSMHLLKYIKYYCLIMSDDYIDKNFNEIKKYANIVEKRIDDSWCTKEFLIKENRYNFDMCKKYDCNYVLIDNNYPIEFFL